MNRTGSISSGVTRMLIQLVPRTDVVSVGAHRLQCQLDGINGPHSQYGPCLSSKSGNPPAKMGPVQARKVMTRTRVCL